MMEPLPFERDRPELLEAAAQALSAVAVRPAQTPPERVRSAQGAPAYAVWRRDAAENAAVQSVSGATPETGSVFSRPDLSAFSAGLSAEELSREIERDARRFEAN